MVISWLTVNPSTVAFTVAEPILLAVNVVVAFWPLIIVPFKLSRFPLASTAKITSASGMWPVSIPVLPLLSM